MQLSVAFFLFGRISFLLIFKLPIFIEGLLGLAILKVILFAIVSRFSHEIGPWTFMYLTDVRVHHAHGPVSPRPLLIQRLFLCLFLFWCVFKLFRHRNVQFLLMMDHVSRQAIQDLDLPLGDIVHDTQTRQ